MQKEMFKITKGTVDNIRVEIVSGYIINYMGLNLGISKSFNHWKITEISTGAYIKTGLKRLKDAIPWLNDHEELLNKLPEILNSERCQKMKQAIKDYRLPN